MANSFLRICISLFALSSLLSCNKGEVYYKFIPLPKNEWSKEQEICFLLDSTSIASSGNYDVSIEISHNIGYQYKNLFLIVNHTAQDSVLLQDTVECLLVDDNGRWYGAGNGATRQLSVPYKTNIKIDTSLHNKVSVSHAMDDLKLKGIEKIGLKVY